MSEQHALSLDPAEAAIAYAVRGFMTLPIFEIDRGRCACGSDTCRSPGKHPRTRSGVYDATSDLTAVRRWWKRWPTANVGIATGEASGVVVIDVDPRNGGVKSLARAVDDRSLPQTPRVETGGDGERLYFSPLPSNTYFVPLRGIDFKAEGGYVVAPPSTHIQGKRYRWDLETLDLALASVPEGLTARRSRQLSRRGTSKPLRLPRRIEDLIRYGHVSDKRYLTRSEAIQAIAHAVREAGGTLSQLENLLLDPSNHGGLKLQEMLPERQESELSRAWTKAGTWRKETMRGEVEKAVRTLDAHLKAPLWGGNAGRTDRAVTRVIRDVIKEARRAEIHLSARQAADLAGISKTTACASLKRLRSSGLIELVACSTGDKPAIYQVARLVHTTQEES